MLNQIRKVFGKAAMGAVVALGAAGAAQATLVVGRFDPAFGAALQGVNYSGTAQFEISQACLNQSYDLFVYRDSTCGGTTHSGEVFDSAHVDFTGAQSGSVDFASGALTVLGMYVQNHHVIGVQTSLSAAATAIGGLAGDRFEIIFGRTDLTWFQAAQESGSPTGHDGDGDLDDFPATDFQVTSLFLVNGSGCSRTNPCPSNPATTHYVPEPGSLSLALGALGVGWLVRRKEPGALVAATA